MNRGCWTAAGVLSLLACTGYRPARYADRPLVTRIADDFPIAVPAPEYPPEFTYLSDTYLLRPAVHALSIAEIPHARDVNARDEVPASSWFSPEPANTLGERYSIDGPPRVPLLVTSGETSSGGNDGLLVVDVRGKPYELFHDPPNRPDTATSARAIASRLLRALGYRVPEVHIVHLAPSDIVSGEKRDQSGDSFLMGGPPVDESGCFQIAAVRWPVGVDLGPTSAVGVRTDDPNDLIPHEDRRTLRALKMVAAWLDWPDVGFYDTRDVYVGARGEGHVQHFLIALHDALGVARLGRRQAAPSPIGNVRGSVFENLFTLGLKPDEIRMAPDATSLAVLEPSADPLRFESAYEPIVRLRADDAYWIARRIAALPEDVIQWAVDASHVDDPKVRRFLERALLSRRRSVVRHALLRVTPLEPVRLDVDRAHLTLRDEAIHYRILPHVATKYDVTYLDSGGRSIVPAIRAEPRNTRLTVPLLDVFLEDPPYVVVRITALRDDHAAPRAFEAHLARAKHGWRLIGVEH